ANPGVVASMREMVAETPAEGYAACCAAIETMDLRDDLARIDVPALVIAGADDPSTPPPHLRTIADGVDGARYLEVAPGAHLASWEQADAVNEALRSHLERVTTEGRR
ncbi:MAG: alpha/beta fold hydrolase, partial [Nocardioidaceae bacterium]